MIGGRNVSAGGSAMLLHQQQQRRVRNLAFDKGEAGGDEALDLFSSTRRSVSIAPGDESGGKNGLVTPNMPRISVGSAKPTRKGLGDLLSAADSGKHDYDWLLTPPGSPLHSSMDFVEAPQTSVTPVPILSARSASATRTSRNSTSNSNSGRTPARPAAGRSSSVARAAIHTARPSTPATSGAARASILNTSTTSTASSRPSTPGTRPSSSYTAPIRPARPSTPAKTRPVVGDKTRPTSSSRPSTPTARPQLSSSSYRPSTPTRRSSPVGPARPAPKPVVPSDFSLLVPANLRTKAQERPASAGRSRPGLPLTAAAAQENAGRRQSISPARPRPASNGPGSLANQKPTVKPGATAEGGGFGRTISKKSLDMALRHMDIRQGMGGLRGAALFPQSVRSTAPRTVPAPLSPEKEAAQPPPPAAREAAFTGRAIGRDIYESSRYDAILLKEDVRNMSWLHSAEDKPDQSLLFDFRLEPLPEPFVML